MLQPWRERLLTALLVIVIAVPVGIVIGGGLDFGGGGADEEPLSVGAETTTSSSSPGAPGSTSTTVAAPASTSTTASTVPGRAPGEVQVRFYNGSRTAGAAVTVGDRLKTAGYDVLSPGPSPAEPLAATAIGYAEGFAAEAAAVAKALGLDASVAKPMPPVPAGVTGAGEADVVVVVAEDAVSPS